MAPEAIDTALSSFSMRRQGASLSCGRAASGVGVSRRTSGRIVSRAARDDWQGGLLRRRRRRHSAARSAGWRCLERVGHRRAEFAIADRCRGRSDRGRCPEAQIEVGVRHSRCVGIGIADHRGRPPRVRRQPQRHGVRARYEDRLSGLGVRGRCRRAIDARRWSRRRRQQHAVLRRRARARLRAGRDDRPAAMEGQGRGSPRRDDHGRRGVSQRTALRAGVVARGRHGGDPDV